MENEESWEAEKASCPGIGQGKVYRKEEIDEILRRQTGQEPIIRV